jgi:hypothetical protein
MPRDESLNASNLAAWTQPADIAEHIAKTVPWLAAPVKNALNRQWNDREFARMSEMFGNFLAKLVDFSSELSELYVKTPEFQRLLEQILIRVGDERQAEKRSIYCAFLSDAVTSPCDPFEMQLRFLQAVRELRLDQIRLIKAVAEPSDPSLHHSLSSLQILEKRMPDIHPDRIYGLLTQMNELGIIRLADLKTTGPGRKLSESFTALGQKLLHFILPRK